MSGMLLWVGVCALEKMAAYALGAFKMPTGSMSPTMQAGDHFLVNRLARSPLRGEVILFVYPLDPTADFVKRVVAVGGDTVQVCGGQLLISGHALPRERQPGTCEYDAYEEDYDQNLRTTGGHWVRRQTVAYREWNGSESYITSHKQGSGEWSQSCTTPVTVPPGHVYVVGDNRDDSHDSRFWGTVRPELVKGTAWLIWWSTGPTQVRWERIAQLIHEPAPPLPAASPVPPIPKPPAPRDPACVKQCSLMKERAELRDGMSIEDCARSMCDSH